MSDQEKGIEIIKQADIQESTVILNLDLGKVTNRRVIASSTENIDTEIDRKMLHVGIDLFDAKELRDCTNFQQSIKYAIKDFCVPSFFRGGMYLVKLEAIQQVEDLLRKAVVDFVPVVEAFANVVDERRDEAKDRLKGEFDASLYPNRAEVLTKFRIDWSWMSMSTPDSLKKISAEFFEREKQKAADNLRAATDGITALLAAEAKKLGDHLIERLTPNEKGEVKVIRKSVVNNINEFLQSFSLRNIGTSEELNAQIQRIQGLVSGIDAATLKVNGDLRTSVADQFKEVAAALDDLIVNKPKRYMVKE